MNFLNLIFRESNKWKLNKLYVNSNSYEKGITKQTLRKRRSKAGFLIS